MCMDFTKYDVKLKNENTCSVYKVRAIIILTRGFTIYHNNIAHLSIYPALVFSSERNSNFSLNFLSPSFIEEG